jgi:hypothetical protein
MAKKMIVSNGNVNPFPIEENISSLLRTPSPISISGDRAILRRCNHRLPTSVPLYVRASTTSVLHRRSDADDKSIVARPSLNAWDASHWLTD